MGIQSTTELSREKAEEIFLDKMINDKTFIKYLKATISLMTDEEVEDKLESTFDNYRIL